MWSFKVKVSNLKLQGRNNERKGEERVDDTAWKVSVFGVILVILLSISPYSVRMRENADQDNSEYGHFLRSVTPSFPKNFKKYYFLIQKPDENGLFATVLKVILLKLHFNANVSWNFLNILLR